MKLLHYLRWSFAVFALLSLLLIGYSLPRISFDNDILALFPQGQQTLGINQADALIAERVTRKVFFLLATDNWENTRAAVPAFTQALTQCACFAQVNSTLDGAPAQNLQQYYSEFTPLLLSAAQRDQLRAGHGATLAQAALRDILANPTTGIADKLRSDPLGTLANFIAQTRAAQTDIRVDETGYVFFEENQKRYLLLYAELLGSPYSVEVQTGAQTAITSAEKIILRLAGGEIIKTGVLFYTLAGTEQARSEISTVGLGSALGILLILLLVFRSPALVVLAFLPIMFGVLLGLVVCYWLFGSVHVVALVFGASLVGVAIDYVLHFFTHRHAMGSAWTAEAGTRHLLPALGLGLVTSVAAYLSFTLAGFPGFTQVAIFSAVGLISACWMVVGLYPWLLASPAKRSLPQSLVRGTRAYRGWLIKKIPLLRSPAVILILALFIGTGLWQLQTTDNIRAMQTPDPALRAMEEHFQSLVGQRTALQYFLVSAADADQLLQTLEALQQPLNALQQQGALGGYQSVANYLPAQATQIANQKLWNEALIAAGPLPELLEQLGVIPEFRQHLLTKFSAAPAKLLSLEKLEPLLVQLPDAPIYFIDRGQHYAVVLLHGLANPQAVSLLADTNNGVAWVDVVAQTNVLLQDYRLITTVMLIIAYFVIWLLFSWRYSWRGSLAIVAPPLLATLLCFASLGWMGQAISVFNMMALLLVLGVGIDAALFMRESAGRSYDTLLAIALSTITTVLSFGLLSFSATAAIHSFGITILFGIIFCFLLSPLAATRA